MTKRAPLLSFVLLAFLSQSIASEYFGPNRDDRGNIVPTPKGEECIAPLDEMRRTHMGMLLHKRDQTVHEGIRTKQASLSECVECHATANDSGEIVRSDNEQYFCSSCHISASVSIDCFECHADRPVKTFDQVSQ